MAAKEKKAKTTTTGGAKLSGKGKLMLLLLTIASIAVLRQSTMMLLVGLLPAIVALIVDTTPNKSWAKTVFCFNMAGLLPSLLDVYMGDGNTMASLQAHMGDMTMWLTAYGAAGMAWIVVGLSPVLAEIFLRYYYQSCSANYRRKMAKLDEEWSIGTKSASQ